MTDSTLILGVIAAGGFGLYIYNIIRKVHVNRLYEVDIIINSKTYG